MALDPYSGDDPPELLTGQDLEDEVAFYREQATLRGEPHDPEWARWLSQQPTDPSGRP